MGEPALVDEQPSEQRHRRGLGADAASLDGALTSPSAAGAPQSRRRQALVDWLQRRNPSEAQVLVASGLAVGIGAGLGAVVFRDLIQAFTTFFFDHPPPRAGHGARHRPPSSSFPHWAGCSSAR